MAVLMCVFAAMHAGAEQAAPQTPGNEHVSVPMMTQEPKIQDLSNGMRGDDVLRLQKRLAELGFFLTAEDGIYGANTQAAVKAFEEYIRLLEQDEIDRKIEAEKTPEPTASPELTPVPTGTPDALSTIVPTVTPTASPSPTPVPTPSTIADGIADVSLQEMLYKGAEALYRRDAQKSDRGLDVKRIQTRLIYLNYLNDAPDGAFGVNTETAVKAFQAAHDMNQTGVADRATQEILFSEAAARSDKPVYNRLYLWVTGEDVKAVQKQLRLLGFLNGGASGTYDERTQEAVRLLEAYLHEIDAEAERAARATAELTATPEAVEATGQPEATGMPDGIVVAPAGPTSVPVQGFVPTGVVDAAMQIRLLEDGIPVYTQTVRSGQVGEAVKRVQRRLYALNYLAANDVDGICGAGTRNAISAFQRRNHLDPTGVADQPTQTILFSEDAVKAMKQYKISISTKKQRVYVHTYDEKDEYTILVKEFKCSTGTYENPTPLGTFTNTGPGARWHYFKKFECWAQYAYYIDGDIMFHSVLYDEQDESTLRKSSVYNLGSRASHGCVRLAVEDAEWIYNNCPSGTNVVVY